MKVITVVAKDYRGLIADISECLTENHINIVSIDADLADTTALVRIRTDNNDSAFNLLNEKGFKLVSRAGLLVKVKDEPGALAKIARRLAQSNIDIRGMNMVEQHDGANIVAISCHDEEKAKQVLSDILV
jgi:hypothetical protein